MIGIIICLGVISFILIKSHASVRYFIIGFLVSMACSILGYQSFYLHGGLGIAFGCLSCWELHKLLLKEAKDEKKD
jgi:hypothetical protein